jgi:hypothetical protein
MHFERLTHREPLERSLLPSKIYFFGSGTGS